MSQQVDKRHEPSYEKREALLKLKKLKSNEPKPLAPQIPLRLPPLEKSFISSSNKRSLTPSPLQLNPLKKDPILRSKTSATAPGPFPKRSSPGEDLLTAGNRQRSPSVEKKEKRKKSIKLPYNTSLHHSERAKDYRSRSKDFKYLLSM